MIIKLSLRSYKNEDDFRRIRDFLRHVFLLNDRRMFSWPVARLDYWRWHGIHNLGDGELERDVFLWEAADGQIAAVLNREGTGHAFLQVHPAFKSAELEEKMIVMAEEHLSAPTLTGGRVVKIWTDSADTQRIDILKRRGYTHRAEWDEHQWYRDLKLPIPEQPVSDGYIIRQIGENSELPSRSWASWRAFHPDEPDDKYDGWRWYLNIQAAPLYRPDLDLVAIAPSGGVAAFTTIWYDEPTGCGMFEPVGTAPEHQRKGLARSLMCEGMRRLKQLGATQCMVSGGSVPANGLYNALLGPIFDLYQPWEKSWI